MLDKKRKHATVHGTQTHGAVYSQDGLLFDSRGAVIVDHPDYDKKARALAVETAAEDEGKPLPGEDEDPRIDQLRSWARGETAMPFPKVRKIMKEALASIPQNAEQALKQLAERGIITDADLEG